MSKKTVISILIAVLVLVLTLSGYVSGLFEKPEYYLYDLQARLLRSDKAPDSRIKVILVDEAALSALAGIAGRWPWPRAIWADLLEFLSYGNPRAVLFDVLFLERQDGVNDGALLDATSAAGNVYHSMMIRHEKPEKEMHNPAGPGRPLPGFAERFALGNVTGTLPEKAGRENNDYTFPITGLSEASKGLAVVEFGPDSDGGNRRTKPLREYQGRLFPVLGLAPFIKSATPVVIRKHAVVVEDRLIPVDDDGNCLINMYGLDTIETYSMSGVFASLQKIRRGEVEDLLVNPETFRDSIVFIGTSAVGTADLKSIPMAPGAPGVMLHVFLANNFLLNDFMTPPDGRATSFAVLIGVALTSWTILFSKRFVLRAVFPLALLALYAAYALFSFRANAQVETAPFLFSTVSTGFLSLGYLSFSEAAEKRRVSHLFTQYVSRDVLHEVLHNYQDYLQADAGRKVELTVLFSDIRGFTSLSEATPPEKVVELLNVHFTVMADIILKHNGTIDKYIGDAVMAFWGAPVRTGDHALQAVRAGREMLEGLKEVNRILKERGFDREVRIGIGINTGEATIGSIGSEKKKNYTVVGDAVNLASRLESATKDQKTSLLFSETTYNKVRDGIACRRIGQITVKGREQPVTIYTTATEEPA